MILAALIISVIRLILRSVFVIITESELVIMPITASLLVIAFMLILQRKGGCSMVILYFLVEPVLVTVWWCLVLYVFNTDKLCHELGNDICEDVSVK